MTYDELKNGLKSLFSTLGAKTSDSNYGVALLDKTSGEPKGLMGMSALASVLGAILFKDVYNQNFDINTLTLDGVSYMMTNVRISLTDQVSATWSGTYPSGLSNAGAQILHFGLGSYKVQLFCAQNGFACRINFGTWKNWIVYKP